LFLYIIIITIIVIKQQSLRIVLFFPNMNIFIFNFMELDYCSQNLNANKAL